jgi:hypothetical protein
VTKVYAPAAPSNQIVVYVSRVQYVSRGREIARAFLFDTCVKNARVRDSYVRYSYCGEHGGGAQVP